MKRDFLKLLVRLVLSISLVNGSSIVNENYEIKNNVDVSYLTKEPFISYHFIHGLKCVSECSKSSNCSTCIYISNYNSSHNCMLFNESMILPINNSLSYKAKLYQRSSMSILHHDNILISIDI